LFNEVCLETIPWDRRPASGAAFAGTRKSADYMISKESSASPKARCWRHFRFSVESFSLLDFELTRTQNSRPPAAMLQDPPPPVTSKVDLLRRLDAIEPSMRKLGVRRLGLFGSFRHDQATPESDIDLYVEFAPGEATFDHYMDLGFLCEDWCGRRVELITPNSLSPHLGQHILEDIEYVLG
jgi:predicted nucleotidyltransferase